jgi:hypothetical protein
MQNKKTTARDNIKSHDSLFLHYVILLFDLFHRLNVLVINNHNFLHQHIHILVNQDVIKCYLHQNHRFLYQDYAYFQLHQYNLHKIDHHLLIICFIFVLFEKRKTN